MKTRIVHLLMVSLLVVATAGLLVGPAMAASSRTYTTDADFDEGTLVNVNHDAPNNDQLQLNEETEPFPFIAVAASGRGTIVRIDTETGEIIGEYWSSPNGRAKNPSRTTVDLYGNVWAGNRDETSGNQGSAVKIGLVVGGIRCDSDGTPNPTGLYLKPPFDYNTCIDRDGDGLIKTSIGLGDIRPWTNAGGIDNNGGVATADDEAILMYVRVNTRNVRHVSVDASNNVWVGGHDFGAEHRFNLLDGDDGSILASFDVGMGGYGGLVDGNGVLWSTSRSPMGLLRYDTKGTITTADDTWNNYSVGESYGLGIDSAGNIWNSLYASNQITKRAPNGAPLFTVPTFGAAGDRGVAVTPVDDNVWVANSWGNTVSRLAADGSFITQVTVGNAPTGVAVDASGKVWATNMGSNSASRIDPATNVVDLTVDLGSGAAPYNYSDMTGIVALQAAREGSWIVVHDSGDIGTEWGTVSWTSDEPDGTGVMVEARAADTPGGLAGETFVAVSNDTAFSGMSGQYIEIRVTLSRDVGVVESAILYDLSVEPAVITVTVPVDIKPTSCPNPLNLKSKGVLPIAILGTEDFDVTQIDPESIRLEGVSPTRWAIEDVATPYDGEIGDPAERDDCTTAGPDGMDDLTLKFDRQTIVAALGEVSDGEVLVLTLVGSLKGEFGGSDIFGEDVVWIRAKGK